MTPQELKNSILQLAIQGKLVEQRPEEGTAAVLYKQIQAEKQALIKAGKIKKEKPLPEITEEEIPFEIPESWKWVRLDDLVTKEIKRGKSPTYVPKSGALVFAQKCNTKAGYIDLSLSLFLDETKLSKYPESEFMRDKDIVINSTGNGTLGRVGIYRNSDNPNLMPLVPDSHVTVIRTSSVVCTEYVFYGLKYYQPYMEKLGSGSTNQTELSANIVRALLFPLPPLAEQKRIVTKIEELLPLIERYEKAWSRLEDFNKLFPGDMQKSILQMAIQGKLVEQRPEEGTGEELLKKYLSEKKVIEKTGILKGRKNKPLQTVDDSAVPYELPDNWIWVRLGNLVEIFGRIGFRGYTKQDIVEKGAGAITISPSNIDSSGKTQFDECTYISWEKYEESPEIKIYDGDIILVKTGSSYGKCGIVRSLPEKATINPQLAVLKYILCDVEYLNIVLKSPMARTQFEQFVIGTSIPTFSQEKLSNMLIPLPPLAEQKRIVARLEELLPLCERLK